MTPLRHVRLTPLTDGRVFDLQTWDTGRTDHRGQTRMGYRFSQVGESEPIFEGEDFCGSPMQADDSDLTLANLLGFLTLRLGDTDRDYFDAYTPRQREWTDDYACEALSCEVSCFEEEVRDNPDAVPPWVDVDDEGDA
jgi:hypothetical protein